MRVTRVARTTIYHIVLSHFGPRCRSLFLVNPIGLEPVVVWNETKLNLSICKCQDAPGQWQMESVNNELVGKDESPRTK